MPELVAVPPPIEWAQRADILWISVAAECKEIDYKFTDETMHFKGASADGTRQYEVTLNFLHKINAEKITTNNTARRIEFCIAKAESGPYWAKLTTDKKKPHFLKSDFNRWHDEDEDNEDDEDVVAPVGGAGDLSSMQNMFANLNAAGGKPNFDDFGGPEGEAEEDSDDEEIPNLE